MKGYYIGVFFLMVCCLVYVDENSDFLINILNFVLCYVFRKNIDIFGVGSVI